MSNIIRTLMFPIIMLGLFAAECASGDTVYCADNKQMKCIGFEEKIVNRNAVCFDPLKCDQEGFVCKSELTAMSNEYEAMHSKYNELADTHNQLIDTYKNSQSALEELQRCVTIATTLEEAQGCL